jgi:hypothetical protein
MLGESVHIESAYNHIDSGFRYNMWFGKSKSIMIFRGYAGRVAGWNIQTAAMKLSYCRQGSIKDKAIHLVTRSSRRLLRDFVQLP